MIYNAQMKLFYAVHFTPALTFSLGILSVKGAI